MCILGSSRSLCSPLDNAYVGGRSSGGINDILDAVAVPRTINEPR
jgi:hypothetical protein